jgi:hypothetical protein
MGGQQRIRAEHVGGSNEVERLNGLARDEANASPFHGAHSTYDRRLQATENALLAHFPHNSVTMW